MSCRSARRLEDGGGSYLQLSDSRLESRNPLCSVSRIVLLEISIPDLVYYTISYITQERHLAEPPDGDKDIVA